MCACFMSVCTASLVAAAAWQAGSPWCGCARCVLVAAGSNRVPPEQVLLHAACWHRKLDLPIPWLMMSPCKRFVEASSIRPTLSTDCWKAHSLLQGLVEENSYMQTRLAAVGCRCGGPPLHASQAWHMGAAGRVGVVYMMEQSSRQLVGAMRFVRVQGVIHRCRHAVGLCLWGYMCCLLCV